MSLAVTVSSLAVLAIPHSASAEDAKPAAIAFVDTPRIMRESAAAKSVRAQLDKQERSYKAELDAQSDKLKQQEQSLTQQRATLTPAQFDQKRGEFQAQVDTLNRQADRRRQQMAFAQDDAMKKLQPVLTAVVGDIAKSVKANIVLDTSRVIVSSNSLDITDPVLKELDKRMPSITVNFNAPETAPPPARAPAAAPSGNRPPPPPPPPGN